MVLLLGHILVNSAHKIGILLGISRLPAFVGLSSPCLKGVGDRKEGREQVFLLIVAPAMLPSSLPQRHPQLWKVRCGCRVVYMMEVMNSVACFGQVRGWGRPLSLEETDVVLGLRVKSL